jgi:tRNA G10  N-methylase Trm11
MEYLIRFAQVHESFRRPEIQALAALAEIDLELICYNEFVGVLFTISSGCGSPSISGCNDLGGVLVGFFRSPHLLHSTEIISIYHYVHS